MILIKGEKPLDLTELLKDIKTKKIIQGMNGYIKIMETIKYTSLT